MFRLRTLAGLILALLISATISGAGVRAQDETVAAADWELTALTDPVVRLFTPASGAFFAQTADAFFRSDDGGSTWRPVSLGPSTTILGVDPTNHAILFAAGSDGVYRTGDDAATWTRSLAYGPDTGGNALGLAVSPADPTVVYLGMTLIPGVSSDFRFFRSQDGGLTWRQLEARHLSFCGWGMPILQPHPSDARRVFRAADCTAGRNFGQSLSQSTDAGDTWTTLFDSSSFSSDSPGYPTRLVGGQGAAPGRLYLAVNRDRRVGGSAVYRSDDDGATWNVVLEYHGGGSSGYTPPGEDSQAPDTWLGGLTYDAANPDRVYAGRRLFQSYFGPPDGGGVVASTDGGATWSDLGRQDIGAVFDLALGIDGANLYAATDQGVWRLRLNAS